jgi:nucleoside-diphosphate-sugar epimerase
MNIMPAIMGNIMNETARLSFGNTQEVAMAEVLILGASGLFGARAAEAFLAAGWKVRRYRRGTDMAAAAQGADVIVNALNPPMYHDWARQIPAITAQVITAARASGATVILPGNVYVYGVQPGPWGAETPHRPCSRKGAIRAAMEAEYRGSGLPVIILRAGDFLDAAASASVMNMVVMKGLARGRLTAIAVPDVPRAYACLPDMARAAVGLAERRADLPRFADIPFAGLTFTLNDWRAEVERQSGQVLRMKPFAWWQLGLLTPFWELARELREMRYLYETPHRLDPKPLAALLPDFRAAGLAQVVAAHLQARGLKLQVHPQRAVA